MSTAPSQPPAVLDLRPGELVRVRSAAQIFATLDADGAFDGLPFMPEMLQFCGRTLPVSHRAHKTCAGDGLPRRMHNTVHLRNVRCDGSAHDGCQAACRIFWKEAWLERAENGRAPVARPLDAGEQAFVANTLQPATRAPAAAQGEEPLYRCQATQIPAASSRLRVREVDQYVKDLQNRSLLKVLRGLLIEAFNIWQERSRRFLPEALLIAGGRTYPFVDGPLEKGTTPSDKLDLEPGDLVRIKSKDEIVATLDRTNRNRGLTFDGEMADYCGRTARVRARVNRLIEESTGEMIEINSDCIILEGVVCVGDYHRFCSRGIYPYWREIWLERVNGNGSTPGACPGPLAE
jgi:hypothetical protein